MFCKCDGIFFVRNCWVLNMMEFVIGGFYFYVVIFFNKILNEGCSYNKDYSVIDLFELLSDYLLCINFVFDRLKLVKFDVNFYGEWYFDIF